MKNYIHAIIKKNIVRIGLLLFGVLCIQIVYLSYIQIVEGPSLYANPLNRRTSEAAKQMERGRILDTTGKVLAFSEKQGEIGYHRVYPYGEVTAHLLGYDSRKYGKTGLEAACNSYLTGVSTPQHRLGAIEHLWRPTKGNDIQLTINYVLQKAAFNALGNRKGAVVALDPRTGAILALVSNPSFDPNSVEQNWQAISGDASAPLLNRSLQGLYPPGSTLKIMIAEAALREKVTTTQEEFTSAEAFPIGKDYTLTESHKIPYKKMHLKEALAESSNITFGKLALALGRNRLSDTFSRYGFNRPVNEIGEMASHIPDLTKLTDGELAQTGIGQGSLLVTPLKMAMLASVFANHGIMMKPYLVKQIIDNDGSVVSQTSSEEWLKPVDPVLADLVKDMMVGVVENGTGQAAHMKGIKVAGKTGTAENPHGQPHAWFVGFAPADHPEIALAIIVENGDAGGTIAAPIARQIFEEALY